MKFMFIQYLTIKYLRNNVTDRLVKVQILSRALIAAKAGYMTARTLLNAPVTHTLTDSYGEFRIKPQSSEEMRAGPNFLMRLQDAATYSCG